jgi:hypothetical protein
LTFNRRILVDPSSLCDSTVENSAVRGVVPRTDVFHDNQLRTMIQNAVHPQANQFKVQHGKDLSYVQYCAPLESVTIAFDDTNKDKPCSTRKVYTHERSTYNIDYRDPGTSSGAITYDVNRTSMTREQWDKLDLDAQKIWDTLPDGAKDTILDRKRPPQRPRYKNNLHEMSAHDLLASLSLGNQTLETHTEPTDSGSTANCQR